MFSKLIGMDSRPNAIRAKVKFLRTDIGLTRTLIGLARTEKQLKNEVHFQRLKGEIQKAIAAIRRLSLDHRIRIPQEDAAFIAKEIVACQKAYEEL